MAIQVIGRDVEDGAHVQVEIVERTPGKRRIIQLQLEAAQLQHDRLTGPDGVQLVDQGQPDVAAHVHLLARGAQHQADQGGGRRLAAAARDGDERPEPCLRRKLQRQQAVVAQRDAALNCSLHDRQLRRHPAAQAQQVTAVEQRQGMAAQFQAHRQAAQLGEFGAEPFGRCSIADRHGGAGGDKEARQGQALPGQTQNDDSFAAKYAVFHGLTCQEPPVRSHLRLGVLTERVKTK